MRIHTSLDASAFYQCVLDAGLTAEVLTTHGSRTHTTAYDVRLSGNGRGVNGPNGSFQSATWDEWGVFFALLFSADNNATAGTGKYAIYTSWAEFHQLTDFRFYDETLPEDTHKVHKWNPDFSGRFYCDKCDASFRRR